MSDTINNSPANADNNDALAQPNPTTRLEGSQQVSPANINELLAALPQMFTGEQQVPLERIRSNPANPGPAITPEMIEELAANIAEVGLKNAIKIRPDRDNLLAPGITLHPENGRLKADGRPLEVGDFNYINLSGELRHRAFQKLQKPTIPSNILNPTDEEAVIITRLDNQVRERGWWVDYQDVESLIQANPNLTQRQVGAKLKIDLPKVVRALRLLPLLNTEAKVLIDSNAINSNKGNMAISEIATSRLADLGPESTLKRGARKQDPTEAETRKLWPYPAIPPETQDLVRRALAVAIDHQMTEAQVKRLVEHIKAGNPADTYVVSAQPKRAPRLEASAQVPETFKAVRSSELGSAEVTAEAKPEEKVRSEELESAKVTTSEKHSASAEVSPASRPQAEKQALGVPTPNNKGVGTSIGATQTSSSHSGTGAAKTHTSTGSPSLILLLTDMLAGVPVIHPIKAKAEKRIPLSWGEILVLSGYRFGQFIGTLKKPVLEGAKVFGKWILEFFKKLFKFIGELLGKPVKAILQGAVFLIILAGLIWLGWDIYRHGVWHPLETFRAKVFGSKKLGSSELEVRSSTPSGQNQEPAPPVQTSASATLPQDQGNSSAVSEAQAPQAVASTKAIVTPQPTPKVQKPDIAGMVAQQAGTDAAASVAKKLFGL